MNRIRGQFHLFRLNALWRRALTAGTLFSGAALLLGVLFLALEPDRRLALLVESIIAAGIPVALVFYLKDREPRRESARKFDRAADSRNRMETFLELEGSGHPLEEAQRNDTQQQFQNYRPRLAVRLIPVLFALFFLVTGGAAGVAEVIRFRSGEAERKKMEQTAERKARQEEEARLKKLAAERAKLILTAPVEELQVKPLDEIEFSGAAESPHGWKKIVLSVYVNGVFRCEIPATPAATKTGGKIKFSGILPLEELEVVPFDLVCFHPSGVTSVGGSEKKIAGEPGFAEVRPFRDDLLRADKIGGIPEESQELLARLFRLLEFEIQLNKSLFRLKIAKENQETQNVAALSRKVAAAQNEATAELDAWLGEPTVRRFPAAIIDRLERARKYMESVETEIGKGNL